MYSTALVAAMSLVWSLCTAWDFRSGAADFGGAFIIL